MTKRTQWLAVAIGSGLLAIAGCQSEGRSDVPPASTMAPSAQPLVMGMNDAMKTSIVLRQLHGINQGDRDRQDGDGSRAERRGEEVRKRDDDQSYQSRPKAHQSRQADEPRPQHASRCRTALSSASEDHKRTLLFAMGARFDVEYIAPQPSSHDVALKLVDEGQKTATGDAKKFLDETRSIVEMHREHAKSLMRGLTFSAAAVGGGPMGFQRPGGRRERLAHEKAGCRRGAWGSPGAAPERGQGHTVTLSSPGDPHSGWEEMPSYVVRPEPGPHCKREAEFETLSSARYFARTWAFKSHIPILVVDARNRTSRWSATPRVLTQRRCRRRGSAHSTPHEMTARSSAQSHSMMAAWSRFAASICAAGAPGGALSFDVRPADRLGAARAHAEPRAVVENDLESVERHDPGDLAGAAPERDGVSGARCFRIEQRAPGSARRLAWLPDIFRRSNRNVPSSASLGEDGFGRLVVVSTMSTRSRAARRPSLSRDQPFGDMPSLSSHEFTEWGMNSFMYWKPTAVSCSTRRVGSGERGLGHVARHHAAGRVASHAVLLRERSGRRAVRTCS